MSEINQEAEFYSRELVKAEKEIESLKAQNENLKGLVREAKLYGEKLDLKAQLEATKKENSDLREKVKRKYYSGMPKEVRRDFEQLKKELELEREVVDDLVLLHDHLPNCDFNNGLPNGTCHCMDTRYYKIEKLAERARARVRERK